MKGNDPSETATVKNNGNFVFENEHTDEHRTRAKIEIGEGAIEHTAIKQRRKRQTVPHNIMYCTRRDIGLGSAAATA